MSSAQEKKHVVLEGVFGVALPLTLLGPSVALYVLGMPLVLFIHVLGSSRGILGAGGPSLLWFVAAGVGLASCVVLARCQRREWLETVSGYLWAGIAVGYAAVLIPIAKAIFRGRGISWDELLEPKLFYLGGGPALYVPIIATWMLVRERHYRRRQSVDTL